MDLEKAKEMFAAEDEIKVKKPKRAAAEAATEEADEEGDNGKFDVRSLFPDEVAETRSEVVGPVRIKPSTRKKLKKLLADEIRKGRKLTEGALISEILEKIL